MEKFIIFKSTYGGETKLIGPFTSNTQINDYVLEHFGQYMKNQIETTVYGTVVTHSIGKYTLEVIDVLDPEE